MYIDGRKKTIIICILKILQKYTDKDHKMSQKEIVDKLDKEYGIEINRTTVKSNINDLIDAGYEIGRKEVYKTQIDKKTGEEYESVSYRDLYYKPNISESELHMLIDGLLFSRSIPHEERKKLIENLGKLSSSYFSKKMNHVHSMSSDFPENPNLFRNIDILDEAIQKKKQVKITYGYYGMDFELHANKDENGKDKWQLLNPYQMVANDGRYYLICNKDNKDGVANYRIDRIIDIDRLKSPVKPMYQVKGLENGLNLKKLVHQSPNMFTGEPMVVKFIVSKSFVGVVIDFFGKNVKFIPKEDEKVECTLTVNRESMRKWVIQMEGQVEVISPPELVEDIRLKIREMAEKYKA